MRTLLARSFIGLATLLFTTSSGEARTIGIDDFTAPTLIDFEDAPTGTIGDFYASLGVTSDLCADPYWNTGTGHGFTRAAISYCRGMMNHNSGFQFSSPVTRVGFFISTIPVYDTLVSAYRGTTLVGSELFDTFGGGNTGSFAGIAFDEGFDRIVLHAFADGYGDGAYVLDELRFETVATPTAVPEPASALLVGAGLIALARRRTAAGSCKNAA